MAYYSLNLLASTYGSGSFDSGNYNDTSTTTGGGSGATTGTGSGSGVGVGTLTNTGIAVIGIVSMAALILLVAMVVRIWKRPAKQEVVPVEIDEPVDGDDVNQ